MGAIVVTMRSIMPMTEGSLSGECFDSNEGRMIPPGSRVSHHPRPLAPGSLVGLGRVGGAPEDRPD
jgi:hypothetical protein